MVGVIAWRTLFNEFPQKMLDPNQPENHPRIIAEREQARQRLQVFVEGLGKPFFDLAKEGIRNDMYKIIISPDDDCNCKTCMKIREIGHTLKMIVKAESIIEDKKT